MAKRKTKVQQYLETATEENLKELVNYINNAQNKKDCLPCPERGWNFTYQGIAPELERRGLITRKHISKRSTAPVQAVVHTSDEEHPPFIVEDISLDNKKVSRSVQLDSDVYERLKILEAAKIQYTHSSILNQLLRDGLKKYGF